MAAGMDLSSWNEVIGAWLTFRIAGARFDPLHSAILIAALAAAIVCAIRLWSIGQREDRQRRLEGLRGSTAQRRALASSMPWYRLPRRHDRDKAARQRSRAA